MGVILCTLVATEYLITKNHKGTLVAENPIVCISTEETHLATELHLFNTVHVGHSADIRQQSIAFAHNLIAWVPHIEIPCPSCHRRCCDLICGKHCPRILNVQETAVPCTARHSFVTASKSGSATIVPESSFLRQKVHSTIIISRNIIFIGKNRVFAEGVSEIVVDIQVIGAAAHSKHHCHE